MQEGINIVRIEGDTYYNLGFDHGTKLKVEIHSLISGVKQYAKRKAGSLVLFLVISAITLLTPFLRLIIGKQYFDELRGISKGSGASLSWILLFNYIYDIGSGSNMFFKFLGSSSFVVDCKKEKSFYFVKIMDLTQDLEFTQLCTNSRITLVMNLKWKNTKVVANTWPGLIVGDFAMNESGVVVSFNDGGLDSKLPYILRKPAAVIIRETVEDASTFDIAVSKVLEDKPQRPYIAVITDGTSSNTMALDLFPKYEAVKYPMDSNFLVRTNYLLNLKDREREYRRGYEKSNNYIGAIKRYDEIRKGLTFAFTFDDIVNTVKIHGKDFDYYNGSVSNMTTAAGVIVDIKERLIWLPDSNRVPITYYGEWKRFTFDEIFN